MELLGQNQIPTPPTVIIAEDSDLTKAMDELGLPLVVKIPDGSFSRGVHKVESQAEFKRVADELFEETDLLLAQKFLPTEFDWRGAVRGGGARGGAAVRVPIPHGARPLADRQAPRRRLRPRGRLPHLRARAGPSGA